MKSGEHALRWCSACWQRTAGAVCSLRARAPCCRMFSTKPSPRTWCPPMTFDTRCAQAPRYCRSPGAPSPCCAPYQRAGCACPSRSAWVPAAGTSAPGAQSKGRTAKSELEPRQECSALLLCTQQQRQNTHLSVPCSNADERSSALSRAPCSPGGAAQRRQREARPQQRRARHHAQRSTRRRGGRAEARRPARRLACSSSEPRRRLCDALHGATAARYSLPCQETHAWLTDALGEAVRRSGVRLLDMLKCRT
jgi:hypothetical protein